MGVDSPLCWVSHSNTGLGLLASTQLINSGFNNPGDSDRELFLVYFIVCSLRHKTAEEVLPMPFN